MRWCLYVDMDAFYVSCELLDRPELTGRPVVVGPEPKSPSSRGVVLSANYEARKFGLRSALSVVRAAALCPQAVWIPPDFSKYERRAGEVRALLEETEDRVVPYSIDEAGIFLDLPDAEAARGRALGLQRRITERLGLPCSIGASPFRVVAKIASDRAKPKGIEIVPPEATAAFLADLPVRALPGVGPKTEAVLAGLGVRAVADFLEVPASVLRGRLGGTGEYFVQLARGTPPEEGEPEMGPPRSRSADRTFPTDTADPQEVGRTVTALAREVSEGLERERLAYQRVTVRLRWADFGEGQRGRSFPAAESGPEALIACSTRMAADLLATERLGRQRPVRLVSVRAERLVARPARQATLDGFGGVPSPAVRRGGAQVRPDGRQG